MNKTFKLYGLLFILFLGILALLELNKTEVTDWRKSFDVDEKAPFGLYVFEKEVNILLNNKVQKKVKTPYEFYKSNIVEPHNILLIEAKIDAESWNKILINVNSGSDAMVISDFFSPKLSDTLKFRGINENYLDPKLLTLTDLKFRNDSLRIDKLPSGKSFYSVGKNIEILGSSTATNSTFANFIRIKYGKGNIYLHSEPLIVTNYYLLKPANKRYIEDVFSYLPDRKTIWFTEANKTSAESSSPLRFILSKPALKYAWWLFLGSLLLFAIFNAKRKQRIVPVIEPLSNKSVEFVKSIGNLYLQEGDFHDMMAKKAQYFLNRVRMDLLIETKNLDEDFQHKLQLKTGKSKEKIAEATQLILHAQDPYARVIKEDLIKMNRLLDEILK